jgi:hypothetical protein
MEDAETIIQGLRRRFGTQAESASTLGLVVNGLVITGEAQVCERGPLHCQEMTRTVNSHLAQ